MEDLCGWPLFLSSSIMRDDCDNNGENVSETSCDKFGWFFQVEKPCQ